MHGVLGVWNLRRRLGRLLVPVGICFLFLQGPGAFSAYAYCLTEKLAHLIVGEKQSYGKLEAPEKGLSSAQLKDFEKFKKELRNLGIDSREVDLAGYPVLEITSIPKIGKQRLPETHPLAHPNLKRYFDWMRKNGYRLIFDPVIGGKYGGAYSPRHKAILLPIRVEWHEFMHEFSHLNFDRLINSVLRERNPHLKLNEIDSSLTLLTEFVTEVSPADAARLRRNPIFKKVEKYLAEGHRNPHAIDEGLAVDRQVTLFNAAGRKPYDPRVEFYTRYKLFQEISGILQVPRENRPARQHTLLRELVYDYLAIELAQITGQVYVVAVLATGAAGGYILWPQLHEIDTRKLYDFVDELLSRLDR